MTNEMMSNLEIMIIYFEEAVIISKALSDNQDNCLKSQGSSHQRVCSRKYQNASLPIKTVLLEHLIFVKGFNVWYCIFFVILEITC